MFNQDDIIDIDKSNNNYKNNNYNINENDNEFNKTNNLLVLSSKRRKLVNENTRTTANISSLFDSDKYFKKNPSFNPKDTSKDDRSHICVECSAYIKSEAYERGSKKYKKNRQNLSRHYQSIHKRLYSLDVEKYMVDMANKEKIISTEFNNDSNYEKHNSSSSSTSSLISFEDDEQNKLSLKVIRGVFSYFLADNNLPQSAGESNSSKMLLSLFGNYQSITHQTVKQYQKHICKEYVNKVKSKIKYIKSISIFPPFCLSFDEWTNNNCSIIGAIISYIDPLQCKIVSFILGLVEVIEESVNSATLINCCDKLLERYDVSIKDLSSVVTDGANVAKLSASTICSHSAVCLCHIIHNCVKYALQGIPNPKDDLIETIESNDSDFGLIENIKSLIDRVSSFASHINRSPKGN